VVIVGGCEDVKSIDEDVGGGADDDDDELGKKCAMGLKDWIVDCNLSLQFPASLRVKFGQGR